MNLIIAEFGKWTVEAGQWMELWCKSAAAAAKSLQSRPTLCDPIDGSPPGSPVPGILQPRALEWNAIAFSDDASLEIGKWIKRSFAAPRG